MYIAMDMGTSNTRLWLCENLEVRHFVKIPIGAGITKTKGKDFLFAEIKNLITTLLTESNTKICDVEYIITSGMVGSELGLKEIPRIQLPADISSLTKNLQKHTLPEITPIPFLFVSGLKKCENTFLLDVMRGEETETIGIIDSLNTDSDFILLLPGTHNKVISVSKDGVITDFYTTMSGELLHTIITNTILSGVVSHQFEPQEDFVLKGAETVKEIGLNAALFKIRVMSLNGISTDRLSSFLYGCILGEETEIILNSAQNKPVFVGGNEILKRVYSILLGENAKPVPEEISANATRTGLYKILNLYLKECDL